MENYEIIEHTADVGLRVKGKSLKELFENAAKGMFHIVTDGAKIPVDILKHIEAIEIKKDDKSHEECLVDYLGELLYIFGKRVNAEVEIKAVTFHNLQIKKDNDILSCEIIFDV